MCQKKCFGAVGSLIHRRKPGTIISLLIIVLSGCGGNTSSSSAPLRSKSAAAPLAVVVLENKSYESVIGNPAAPYLNQLAQIFALATQYYADTHPSIGNYFTITTGQVITNVDSFSGVVTADNLAREIAAAGKTWKVYAQGLPAPGYTGGDKYPYLRHHNSFSFFSDVLNSPAAAQIVPFEQLATDIASGTLPDFLFILPDAQHDAHDCPAGVTPCTDDARLASADAWLSQNIDPLLHSSAFASGVLVVTFDESFPSDTQNGGGHVATVVAGNPVKNGFQSTTFLQHADLLRFVCDRLVLGTCPGAGSSNQGMNEFLR